MLDTCYKTIKLNNNKQKGYKMTKAKRLIEVVIATGFVFGMTAIGFRIGEPTLGLFAALPVWLYFKADFSK